MPPERTFVIAGAGAGLAGMNFNVWDVTDDTQALIAAGAPVDERRLADPAVPLAELAARTLTTKEP
jgi:3-phenylpropionate/trans-cinnamate dioxygenase ferredoxin reductase subunit